MFGHAKVVELLLEHGADPNKGWALGDVGDHDYQVAPIMALVMNLSSWNKQASHEVFVLSILSQNLLMTFPFYQDHNCLFLHIDIDSFVEVRLRHIPFGSVLGEYFASGSKKWQC